MIKIVKGICQFFKLGVWKWQSGLSRGKGFENVLIKISTITSLQAQSNTVVHSISTGKLEFYRRYTSFIDWCSLWRILKAVRRCQSVNACSMANICRAWWVYLRGERVRSIGSSWTSERQVQHSYFECWYPSAPYISVIQKSIVQSIILVGSCSKPWLLHWVSPITH